MTLMNGETKWVHTDKIPFFYDNNEVTGLIVFVIDITERKRIEDALRATNKKLHLLSDITRHDILNQIQVLLFHIDSLQTNSYDPQIQKKIEKTSHSVQNIERQISFNQGLSGYGSPGTFVAGC